MELLVEFFFFLLGLHEHLPRQSRLGDGTGRIGRSGLFGRKGGFRRPYH